MSKIQEKIDQLKKSGFDFGLAIDTKDQSAGYGGQYRRFKNTTIYWHPVMNTEAHEVHGGILTKYLKVGGYDVNPATGKRDLGFPLSDEIRTQVKYLPVSYFEWGCIIWKDGGLMLSGDFYTAWKDAKTEAGSLGYPVSEAINVPGGQVVFFEYGFLWKGNNIGKVLTARYRFPKIGNPAFIGTDDPKTLQQVGVQMNIGSSGSQVNLPLSFYSALLNGRLYLVPTGQSRGEPVAITFSEANTNVLSIFNSKHLFGKAETNFAQLSENTLYDIALKLPSGNFITIAPHAIYIKNSWKDFVAMHSTDIHVSRRLDGFRDRLKKLGRNESASVFNNYNNNFRELIKYANKLHDAGKLDLIIATGDLVEYEFEEGEYDNNSKQNLRGGNFEFLERMICGRAGSPDGVSNDELRVPILTTPGNHDYRAYRFMLNFDIDIPVLDDPTIRNYAPMNLTNEDANDLQGGFKTISKDAAIEMAKVDEQLEYYNKRFCSDGSFIVPLGKHQILMLDTKWDKDIIDTNWEAFKNWLGAGSESSKNFSDGNPDSQGLDDSQIKLVRNALNKTEGLVFIGMHAPPVNPKGNEYPHYFRETEHAGIDINYYKREDDITAYLRRHSVDVQNIPGQFIVQHKGWFETNGMDFFYTGSDGDNLLDYGISKDKIKEFLQMCAGVGVKRKPEVILCGHIHKRAEFRLDWNASKNEIRLFFDFYTENPIEYYPSKKWNFDKPVILYVSEGASVPSQTNPPTITKHTKWGAFRALKIPPYANTLNKAANKSQWWNRHRPLVLQTAAVGPTEANQRLQTVIGEQRNYPGPSFQGCRIITVKNDIIDRIDYVELSKF